MRLAYEVSETTPSQVPVREVMDRISEQRWLDRAVAPLQQAVKSLPLGGWRNVMHGTWLGHPVHPSLVQVPLGAWTSAAVLDLVPGQRHAATVLVAVGLAGAVPAGLVGAVDWAELNPQQTRVGLVHAAAMLGGTALYGASLLARVRGRRMRGRMLGFAGLAVVSAGGALGGHLAYRQAAGPNHAGAVADLAEQGWQPLAPLERIPVQQLTRYQLGQVPVVVWRELDDTVRVLAEQCSHLSGPLADGAVEDGCVVCPWHGSTFRLADGTVAKGPATAPQPVFESRVTDGQVEVRAPQDT